MTSNIIIDRRFCGPPKSGNGGYVCGLVANFIAGPAEVRLHKPVPIGRYLKLEHGENSRIRVHDGNKLIATAAPADFKLAVPQPPTFEDAQKASENYLGFRDHVFPNCFVCGPRRIPGDGLNLFPGTLHGDAMVATPWLPDVSLADDAYFIKPEFLWAALDCPGAFALAKGRMRPAVLGTLKAEITRPVKAGEACVVLGWEIGVKGRKHFAGTAVFTASGDLCAKALAIWIEVDSLQFSTMRLFQKVSRTLRGNKKPIFQH